MTDIYPDLYTNISTIADVVKKANQASAGYDYGFTYAMGYMILVIIMMVTYLWMKDDEMFENALPPVLFVGYVTSTFLSLLQILPSGFPVLLLIAFALSIAYTFANK